MLDVAVYTTLPYIELIFQVESTSATAFTVKSLTVPRLGGNF